MLWLIRNMRSCWDKYMILPFYYLIPSYKKTKADIVFENIIYILHIIFGLVLTTGGLVLMYGLVLESFKRGILG